MKDLLTGIPRTSSSFVASFSFPPLLDNDDFDNCLVILLSPLLDFLSSLVLTLILSLSSLFKDFEPLE
jgi:hypothetical protein